MPSLFPFAFNLSRYRDLFPWIGFLHHMAKVLELEFQDQPFQWIFRVAFLYDWLVWSPCSPRTLKSLLKQHNSKASVLWCSALFMNKLSHLYMITGKTIALTIWTFVSKVVSLLFNMLSRCVIAFLPRNKFLLHFNHLMYIQTM